VASSECIKFKVNVILTEHHNGEIIWSGAYGCVRVRLKLRASQNPGAEIEKKCLFLSFLKVNSVCLDVGNKVNQRIT